MHATSTEDVARLKRAASRLKAAGVLAADAVLRHAAASATDKAFACWDGRDEAKLAQMVKQGGPSVRDMGHRSERQRIIAERNAWMENPLP